MARLQLPDLTRAICHPKRPHAERGLCRQCLIKEQKEPSTGLMATVRKSQAELVQLHKTAGRLEALEAETKAIMRENLPAYAELHKQAATVAAEKGDSRPIEWALQHVKMKDAPIVEAPAKEPATTGVRVFVGINMGGVPSDTIPTIQMLTPPDDPL